MCFPAPRQVLTELLAPQGVMKIGLYSELARQIVVQFRKVIADKALENTDADIRKLRDAVLMGEFSVAGTELSKITDFYSISSCRDLLFHVQEHRFYLSKISEHLQQLKLNFLGFHAPKKALVDEYRKAYPDDQWCNNLNNWVEFEKQNPQLFTQLMHLSMHNFWCQK